MMPTITAVVPSRRASRGNRRVRRRARGLIQRAPLEVSAMQARLTSGPMEPPPIAMAIKTIHRLDVPVTVTGNTLVSLTNSVVSSSIPGGAGWAAYRIIKVSLYGPTQSVANVGSTNTVTNYDNFVGIQMPGDTSFLDANTMTYEDHSRDNAHPPVLHVLPCFAQRLRWYKYDTSDNTTVLFKVASNGDASPRVVYLDIQLTIELQSTPVTPVSLRKRALLSPDDEAVRSDDVVRGVSALSFSDADYGYPDDDQSSDKLAV